MIFYMRLDENQNASKSLNMKTDSNSKNVKIRRIENKNLQEFQNSFRGPFLHIF